MSEIAQQHSFEFENQKQSYKIYDFHKPRETGRASKKQKTEYTSMLEDDNEESFNSNQKSSDQVDPGRQGPEVSSGSWQTGTLEPPLGRQGSGGGGHNEKGVPKKDPPAPPPPPDGRTKEGQGITRRWDWSKEDGKWTKPTDEEEEEKKSDDDDKPQDDGWSDDLKREECTQKGYFKGKMKAKGKKGEKGKGKGSGKEKGKGKRLGPNLFGGKPETKGKGKVPTDEEKENVI